MKNKYRIINSWMAGYFEVQIKHWYWPFWTYVGTKATLKDATKFIKWHRNGLKTIYYEG